MVWQSDRLAGVNISTSSRGRAHQFLEREGAGSILCRQPRGEAVLLQAAVSQPLPPAGPPLSAWERLGKVARPLARLFAYDSQVVDLWLTSECWGDGLGAPCPQGALAWVSQSGFLPPGPHTQVACQPPAQRLLLSEWGLGWLLI